MSVFVLRLILLSAFTLCIKLTQKCRIASPGKVIGLVILFPVALFLVDYIASFALRGLSSNAELLSAIYAVGEAIAGVLTVLVYFVLYKYIVGESTGVRAMIKRQPKWYVIIVCILILAGAVVVYIQDVSVAAAASSMAQMVKDGSGGGGAMVCVLGELEAQKWFTYARNTLGIVIALLTVFAWRAKSDNGEKATLKEL